MRLSIIIILFILLAQVQGASATNYYIEQSGCSDSNSGLLGSPWCTIGKANATLIAGDTVYIGTGTYYEQISPTNSGNSTNGYLKYIANGAVNINTTNKTYLNASVNFHQKDWVWVQGFNIYNDRLSYGILAGANTLNASTCGLKHSSYVVIKDNYLYGAQNSRNNGIRIGGCGGTRTLRNTDIIIDNNTVDERGYPVPYPGDPESISLSQVDNGTISNNTLMNVTSIGIDLKAGNKNVTIYGNNITYPATQGIYLDGYALLQNNVTIYNNYVFGAGINHPDSVPQSCVVVNMEEGVSPTVKGYIENISIFNNILDRCTYYGVHIGGDSYGTVRNNITNISVHSNTIINNNVGSIRIPGGDDTNKSYNKNFYIRNNIMYGNDATGLYDSINKWTEVYGDYIVDYNHFGTIGSGDEGTNYLTGDPLFTDYAGRDYTLTSSSSAIDNGTATGAPSFDYNYYVRPVGSGYDKGVFEYGASAPPSSNYIPPILSSCSATNTSSSVNVSCTGGSGNITNSIRVYNVNTSTWNNVSTMYALNSGLNSGTAYTFRSYPYNSSGTGTINNTYTTVLGTTTQAESTPTFTIKGSGGNATWSSFTQNNVTEDLGDHDIKIGIFADNFDDNDASAWTNTAGDWSVSGGVRIQSNTGNIYELTYPTGLVLSNVDLQSDILTSSIYGTSSVRMGLFGRMQTTGNQYEAFVNGVPATSGSSSIMKRVSGAGTTLNSTTQNKSDYDVWTKFRFQLDGTNLKSKFWATGAEPNWMSTNITDNTYSSGYAGVEWTYSAIKMDNFIIRNISNGNVITSGNFTSWWNTTNNNVTYQLVVNATTPTNTNYSVLYRQNATGDYVSLASAQTGNTTHTITTKYQNTDVRVVLNGNETATPELIQIIYYAQEAEESDPSTTWTFGIAGQFFQNKTIGSNKTCINQGDGAIGIGLLCDNFNDNNTVGWTQTGTGTIYVNNGVLEQTIDSSWLHKNTTSYENISMFAKFKATYLLSDFDISLLRGNLSRDNGFYQFAVGGSTWNSTRLSLYNSSSWITINNTQRKNREVNVWNYTYSKIYGDILELYIGTSYSNALLFVQASGTNSFYKNGTVIKFGGHPNSGSAIMSWDEIRAVELDALGNQYLSGNYSMNYTVPASQYAKNITINGTFPADTNYSLKYRQNATGDYVAVEGIKTANATIELPTPYYQNIDILLEMNSTESDTLWITNITVGVSATTGATSIYNTGYQYVLVNDTMTNSQLNTIWSPTWIIGWNSTSQKWETYKSGWPIRLSRISNKGDAVGIKITTNKSISLTYNETYNWTLVPGQNLIGLENTKTLSQINNSINNNQVDKIEYVNLETQTSYIFNCGESGNESIQVKDGEGIWINSTINIDKVRSW